MGRDGSRNKKGGRGSGKKSYIANVEELAIRNQSINDYQQERARRRGEDDEDEEEDGSGDHGVGESVFDFERKSRSELAAEKNRAKSDVEEEEDEAQKRQGLLAGMNTKPNANRLKKPTEKMIKIKDMNNVEIPDDITTGLTRKQKEVLAEQQAKDDHERRYLAGETEDARRQLEQLAIVRARREEQKKKREMEGRKPGWLPPENLNKDSSSEEDSSEDDTSDEDIPKKPVGLNDKEPTAAQKLAAKKKAAAAAIVTDDDNLDGVIPKLKAMDIKKMNPNQLKEKLKERDLNIQGAKKDLMKRLIDYEAARTD